MIILYDCATAPSPRRARILLAEKGIAHDTVQVDLAHGEQLGAAYREINPQCTVPALRIEEGGLLTDNAAIAAYLEARYPEPPLMGRTPQEKAEIASWNWRVEFEGLLAIAETLRNGSPAMADRALPGPVALRADSGTRAARAGARAAFLRDAERAIGRPRVHRHRPVQPGRHHRRGGGGLCPRGARQARGTAPRAAALARGDGAAPVDGTLNRNDGAPGARSLPDDQRSTASATPMPPPMHSDGDALLGVRAAPSRAAASPGCGSPTRRSGGRCAIAPPLTLTLRRVPAHLLVDRAGLRGERLVDLDQVEVGGLPAGALAAPCFDAGTGPMPMIAGSTPDGRVAAMRASGFRPSCCGLLAPS